MNTSITSQNESILRRIQRTSCVLRCICTVLLVLAGFICLAAIVMMAAGRLTAISTPGGSIPLDSVTPAGRATLLVTSVLAVAVLLKGLYHLRALLGNYSRREVFAVDSARQIRQFGITCVLWGVLKIVSGFLPLILLGDARDPTHIELDDLLMGAVIIVISWFAEMAAAVREENDLTI